MNLKEIRQEFAEKSGQLDLVNEDGSDNGANFYLNAGQQYLDKLIEKKGEELFEEEFGELPKSEEEIWNKYENNEDFKERIHQKLRDDLNGRYG